MAQGAGARDVCGACECVCLCTRVQGLRTSHRTGQTSYPVAFVGREIGPESSSQVRGLSGLTFDVKLADSVQRAGKAGG